MRLKSLFLAAAVVGSIAACEDDSTGPDEITYTATLSGANERPDPVTTTATGTFTGTLDTETNVMDYTVTWQNLSSVSNNAHIHGPTAATGNAAAGVLIDFNSGGRTMTHGTSGTATGTIDLDLVTANAAVSGDSLRKLLDAGRTYVNIHSVNNPGGEILGIITKQ